MFKRLGMFCTMLAALTMLAPGVAQAREHERVHHRHRVSVIVGIGPRHYADGHYDRWGYWHPNGPGFYDRLGRWHPY